VRVGVKVRVRVSSQREGAESEGRVRGWSGVGLA